VRLSYFENHSKQLTFAIDTHQFSTVLVLFYCRRSWWSPTGSSAT